MVYKKYDNYKESGVSWIGKIPEGWDVRRLKDAYSSTNSGEVIDKGFWNTGNELLYTCQKTPMASDFDAFPKFKRTSKHDLLLTRNATPYIFIPFENAIYSNVVQRIVMHNKFDKRFVKRALECGVNAEQVNGDTIPSWNMQVWNNISFAFPCISEQKLISDYLDKKTSNIDKHIEKLLEKSEKYKVLRKNLVSYIVTHGLNSNVKMKDSGIEWFERIPDNWEIKRIKDVIERDKNSMRIGPFGSALTNKVFAEGDYKVYGQRNIIGKDFSAGDSFVSSETFKELISYEVKTNDILISMMGTVGKCATVPSDIQAGIMDSHVIKARLNKKIIIDSFFEYVYDKDNSSIVFNQLTKNKKGSIMDGLNSSIIKSLFITIPPINEQKDIVEYLDNKTSKIDKILTKIDEEIEKLKELRKVLINDAVTGKIKVI